MSGMEPRGLYGCVGPTSAAVNLSSQTCGGPGDRAPSQHPIPGGSPGLLCLCSGPAVPVCMCSRAVCSQPPPHPHPHPQVGPACAGAPGVSPCGAVPASSEALPWDRTCPTEGRMGQHRHVLCTLLCLRLCLCVPGLAVTSSSFSY